MDNTQNVAYSEFVKTLAKTGEEIKSSLTSLDCHGIHMVMGIAGEAGELIDAVKKIVIYRKMPDIENVIEELGDLEFYMEGLRQAFGITREDCLTANFKKLTKRYQLGYSNQAAQQRADKQ